MPSIWLLLIMLSTTSVPDGDEVDRSRPADLLQQLDHPDRWRWIPEDRIPEGKLLQRILVTSFVSPFVFFEGDVGTGGGFTITDIDFRNKRRSQLANIWATYTTEGQERFSISWKKWLAHSDHPGRGVLQGDRDFLGFTVSHSRTLTSRFFGLGSKTLFSAEGSYSRETNSIGVGIQRSYPEIGGDWVWNANLFLQSDDLETGKASEILDVEIEHPELFVAGDDYQAMWIQAGIRHDTRDAQHLPYQGHSIGFSINALPIVDDRDSGAVASLTGKWIRPVPALFHNGGDRSPEQPAIDSIAGSLSISTAIGEVPFWALPTLGGDEILRGTIRGRWRDRSSWSTAAEWRPWVLADGLPISGEIRLERVGLAFFAEAGSVAENLGALADASIHSSVGIGIRLTFERQALFRMDFGRSDEGDTNLSIAYGLPF